MRLYYTDIFVLPLPEGHRFPMVKYARLRERLAQAGAFAPTDFRTPEAAGVEALSRAHAPDYIARVLENRLDAADLRRIGFPWSAGMVERSLRSAGATLEACRSALEEGCAANLAGGTHHAHADRGEGFCVFNDAAVAALTMLAEGRARRITIIDCDVHQGNGTASILADEPRAFTFSIHGARNFPFDKAKSDLDIELPDDTGDAAYLAALDTGLMETLARANPDLVIYLAGADPYVGDRLGRLSLSMEGLRQRDEFVLETLRARGIPAALAMAGGYAQPIDDTVAIHATTVLAAQRIYFG